MSPTCMVHLDNIYNIYAMNCYDAPLNPNHSQHHHYVTVPWTSNNGTSKWMPATVASSRGQSGMHMTEWKTTTVTFWEDGTAQACQSSRLSSHMTCSDRVSNPIKHLEEGLWDIFKDHSIESNGIRWATHFLRGNAIKRRVWIHGDIWLVSVGQPGSHEPHI